MDVRRLAAMVLEPNDAAKRYLPFGQNYTQVIWVHF